MDAIDYKILLENIFQKAGQLLQVRDSTEVEIAKLNQLFCATLNMVPHDQRLFFKSRMVEIGAMKDCGLNEGIRNVLLAAEGKKTRVRGGRVEISLLKNGLGDLAANAPASAANGNGGVSGATNAVPSANSNEVQQPAAPATNVAPAPQQGGMTTEKPSPATSKPPRQ